MPHRMVRSAKDLACATLSGTFELNDVRSSKQANTPTQASSHYENHGSSSSTVRSRPDSKIRENSFRHQLNATACKEAQEDFDQFQALDDFQKQQHLEFATCLESLRDLGVARKGPDGFEDVLQPPHYPALDSIVEKHVSSVVGLEESPSRPGLVSASSACETDADFARAAAFRRLHQIGAHLQQNLAMQVSQQDAYGQAHVSMHHALSNIQDEQIQQRIDEHRGSIQSDQVRSDRNTTQKHIPSHQQGSIAQIDSPLVSPPEKEGNMLQRQFHCPYYACHRNLQLLSTSGSSSSQTWCVHVGCEFRANSFDSWAEHIHVPHHDLLGSS